MLRFFENDDVHHQWELAVSTRMSTFCPCSVDPSGSGCMKRGRPRTRRRRSAAGKRAAGTRDDGSGDNDGGGGGKDARSPMFGRRS